VNSDPLIGRELAGYRIEEFIGRGGMGVVYRAEHVMLGRKDAIKLLASELSTDTAFRERFLRESRIAAGMDHPNVIPIFHAGEVDGLLYLAMRYVQGSDLRTHLEQRGQLTLEETVAVVEQVASALDAAHERGLVHRDVKPANILISHSGHVYLTDFGIAKHTRTRGGLTKPGSFLGTLDYAAPEQIEGKQIDGRADQYALGCVLYHCLAGVAPYEKDSDVQLIYAHLLERAPPVTSRRPRLPPGVDAVLDRALAKKRDDRYLTCGELASALESALEGATDEASAAARAAPTRAARRPEPAAEAAAAPPRVPAQAPERPPPPEPPEPPARAPAQPFWRRLPVLVAAGGALLVGIAVAIALAVAGGGSGGARKAAEKRLLALVPTGVRSSCVRLGAPAPAEAGVTCKSRGQGVSYYGFASRSALENYYAGIVPSGYVRNRGSCADLPLVGERAYRTGGKTVGRIFCALAASGGTAKIGWTDDRVRIAARATRGDGNQRALYSWWAASGGPLGAAGAKTVPRRTAPVSAGAVLFADSLSRSSTGLPPAANKVMHTAYVGGGYEAVVERPNKAALPSTVLLTPPLSFGDVEVQVDAKVVSAAGGYSFGVTCRSRSKAQYRLEVQSDGEFLITRANKVLNHKSFGRAVLGSTNRVHGYCSGGGNGPVRLRLTLKGKALTATDKSPLRASGAVGLVAESRSKGGVKIRFRNLVVRNR
jgi:serine/threonine-protein kinase